MRLIGGISLSLGALLVAGCPVAPVAPGTPASQAPLTRKAVAGSVITGKLIAPANVIATDGASVIAADGASVIATGGLNVIAADGASAIARQRRVLQAKEVRIAGAEVFLADGAGERIPGLPAVKTDANGMYTVPNVPAGYTYLVVARIPVAQGEPARLVTLARSTAQGATATISGETTLAATGVIRRFSGALGEFNQARYAEAIQLVRDNMASVGRVNWSSLTDVVAKLEALERRVSALEAALADLRAQVTKIEETVADIQADLEQIKEAQASPSPVASPLVTPSPAAVPASVPPSPPAPERYALPDQFVRGLTQTAPEEPGSWTYGHSTGAAADGPFGWFQWGRHSSGNDAYINKVSPDGALVMGSTTEMFVHPSINDTVIAWVAPADGTLDLVARARLQSEKSNGVNLTVFLYRPSEFKATPVVAGDIRVGPAPEFVRLLELSKRGVEVKANHRLHFQINANGGTGNDTAAFSTEILFTPAR